MAQEKNNTYIKSETNVTVYKFVMPVKEAVYQYQAEGPWRYCFSKGGIDNSWRPNGIAFYGVNSKTPGSVPIYQFWANTNGWARQCLSTNPNKPSGYGISGIAFHAFSSQKPGTVPVYQYYGSHSSFNSFPTIYHYSTSSNFHSGWTKTGVAFYAYSK